MPSSRPVVVVADEYSSAALGRLSAVADVVVLGEGASGALKAAIGNADALLVRTRTQVSRDVIDAAPRLRVIARGGVGVENIDLRAASARGIPVVYTPAAATEAVAELTIGLVLALERKIVAGDASVRSGAFEQGRRDAVGRELGQCTVGIIGMGRIGRAVGRSAALGFGARVIYNDVVTVDGLAFPAGPVTKEELYATADVISLHVPLTDLTRGLIDAVALSRFRPSATLINTARGAVVDAGAVAAALREGRLAGAAFDVFDAEPPPPDHPLLHAPNVILSPHAGARSHRGLTRMEDVVEDVIAVLEGRAPRHDATRE